MKLSHTHQRFFDDFGYLALGVRERAERQAARQPASIVESVEGYAAGINAWLADA